MREGCKKGLTPFLFIPTLFIPLPPLIKPFLCLAKHYYPIASLCKLWDILADVMLRGQF